MERQNIGVGKCGRLFNSSGLRRLSAGASLKSVLAHLYWFISVGPQPLWGVFKRHGMDTLGLKQLGRAAQSLQLASLAVHLVQVNVLIPGGDRGGSS